MVHNNGSLVETRHSFIGNGMYNQLGNVDLDDKQQQQIQQYFGLAALHCI